MAQITSARTRGCFFLFEGLDRSGKTTQARMLSERLANVENRAVDFIRFPNRTSITGRIISEFLAGKTEVPDESIHLLFSANRWENKDAMIKNLTDGTNIVCDRYAYSGVAYSSAKTSLNNSLDWCKNCDRGLPSPDCIFFLDVDPVYVAANRGGYGEERYEKIDFQARVRQMFSQLQETDNSSSIDVKRPRWFTLDGSRSIESLHEEIFQLAQQVLQTNQIEPIHPLWK